MIKLKDNTADKDSLQETRDELALRLTTLENVTTAGKQVSTHDRHPLFPHVPRKE